MERAHDLTPLLAHLSDKDKNISRIPTEASDSKPSYAEKQKPSQLETKYDMRQKINVSERQARSQTKLFEDDLASSDTNVSTSNISKNTHRILPKGRNFR
jgi:hypothetical protein